MHFEKGSGFCDKHICALAAGDAYFSFMKRRPHSLSAFGTFEILVCIAILPFLLLVLEPAADALSAVQVARVFRLPLGDVS